VENVTATRHQAHLCRLALWLVLAGSSDPSVDQEPEKLILVVGGTIILELLPWNVADALHSNDQLEIAA
jgi:hypothetical protein